ncbi:hypothetical protein Hanom_Chr02g00149611 [Helianthus anomalus]
MVRLKRIIEYLRRKPPRSTDRNLTVKSSSLHHASEFLIHASGEEGEGYNSWIMNNEADAVTPWGLNRNLRQIS